MYKMCYGIFYKNLNLEIGIPLSKYFDLSVNIIICKNFETAVPLMLFIT